MGRGPHLYRRGAVYHWQRRLPSRFASHLRIQTFRLSLNTKNVETARRLVPALDAYAAEVFMTAAPELLTKEKLQVLFKRVLVEHQAKLRLLADLERQRPTSSPDELLQLELGQGHAYRLLSERGGGGRQPRRSKATIPSRSGVRRRLPRQDRRAATGASRGGWEHQAFVAQVESAYRKR